MLSPTAASSRKQDRLSLLFIAARQGRTALSLHNNTPTGGCRSGKLAQEWVFISTTDCSGDSQGSMFIPDEYVVATSTLVSKSHSPVEIPLFSFLNLHINRTGPQWIYTHHITNPSGKNLKDLFPPSALIFHPGSSYCFAFIYIYTGAELMTAWRFELRVECRSALNQNSQAGGPLLGVFV